MKKLVTITGCFMFVCIMITSVILPSIPKTGAAENNINVDTESVIQNDTSSAEKAVSFFVKEYNGMIAVFEGQAEEPLFVSDMSVNNLPEADKKLLETGIEVGSKKELKRLIEDYCS